jgi:DNA-binding beta-propeller fold protein YncE
VGTAPRGLALDARGARLLVANAGDRTLSARSPQQTTGRELDKPLKLTVAFLFRVVTAFGYFGPCSVANL